MRTVAFVYNTAFANGFPIALILLLEKAGLIVADLCRLLVQ